LQINLSAFYEGKIYWKLSFLKTQHFVEFDMLKNKKPTGISKKKGLIFVSLRTLLRTLLYSTLLRKLLNYQVNKTMSRVE
jgi:hypothetical protein